MAIFRDAQPAAPSVPAPDEAKRQIAETMAASAADPKHPYMDQTHPMSEHVRADMKRWHEIAYPEGVEEVPPGYDHIPAPLGEQYNPEAVDEFRAEAGKLGVAVSEADHWLGRLYGPAPHAPVTKEVGEAVLGRQWADHYAENLALARAFRDRLPEAVRERLLERCGNDPGTIVRCCELERALRSRAGA